MRLLWFLFAGLLVGSNQLPAPDGERQTSPLLVIRHVTVIDVEAGRAEADRAVSIRGDRIVSVQPDGDGSRLQSGRTLDGRGLFIMPGLWDAHAHLSYLGQCSLARFVADGITSVRDLGSRPQDIAAWRGAVRAGRLVGPRILSAGANLESTQWLERAYRVLPPGGLLWRYGPRLEVADAAGARMAWTASRTAGPTW